MLCCHKSPYVDNLRMPRILVSAVHSSPHRRWQLPLGTPLFYSEVIPMDAIRGRTLFPSSCTSCLQVAITLVTESTLRARSLSDTVALLPGDSSSAYLYGLRKAWPLTPILV
jgi:hypothetical protein